MFLLPHSIVTVSIVTALLPRMSRAAAEGRLDGVRHDLSQGLRLAAVAVIPASLVFLLMGPELGATLFSFGAASLADGRYIGLVLSGFAVGLVPFSVHHLLLRGFYAQEDTRTPFFLACLVAALDATFAVVAFLVLPVQWKTVGMAAGYALAYAVGATVSAATLRKRVGGLDGRRVMRTYVRLAVAGLLAGLGGFLVLRLIRLGGPGDWWSAALGLVVGGVVAAAGYLWLARRMRVTEVSDLLGGLGARLPGRLGRRGGH
jgi:putative peptidoglycan lipid II flippase